MSISASSRDLLSHPKEESRHLLADHLESVGRRARSLYCRSKFGNPDVPFYAGLLHDLGKINPLYQEIFHANPGSREDVRLAMERDLARVHAPLSAWAASHLLRGIVTPEQRDAVTSLIYGHHTRMRRVLGKASGDSDGSRFRRTVGRAAEVLPGLRGQVGDRGEFGRLNWDRCESRFNEPVRLNVDLADAAETWTDSFLDMSFAFSCLLQADRGSFREWGTPSFDIKMNPETQAKGGRLAALRTDFQRHASESFNPDGGISVLNAPTGIGKTKALLEMINRFAGEVERVFYFSPLLALTEDIEMKMFKAVPENRRDDVLVYTHLFAGSLRDRESGRIHNAYVFENESFNKPLVIATTQRLLMTLYSNSARDKLKMASFANSVLIIDEIQTVAKPVLAHLVSLFKAMNSNMNTRFVLVSATIPHELAGLERIAVPGSLNRKYLEATKKSIRVGSLDPAALPSGRVLVMANTRSKAAQMFRRVSERNPNRDIRYLSGGIRKRDRREMILELGGIDDCILVATQVVEAGVDLSFSRVYREMAPLDSVAQAMGRLNREGEADDALMVVYETNDGDNVPYNKLEFDVSARMVREVGDSVGLYERLDCYYREVSERNLTADNTASDLESLADRNDFDGVWDLVRRMAIPTSHYNTVYVPDEGDYRVARADLADGKMRRWADTTASLPVDVRKLAEMFDEELYEGGMLLPKPDMLGEVYDSELGLDKWTQ